MDPNPVRKTLSQLAHEYKQDPACFDIFYETARKYINYWAKNNQDVVQNAWIRILTGLDTFDPQYPFEPWAQKIVKNSISDFYARKADSKLRAVNLPPDALPIEHICFDPNPSAEDGMLRQELLEKAEEVIRTFTPKRREVLRLKFLGYSFKEISDILDFGTPEMIKNVYFNALNRLKTELEEKGILE